MDTNTMIVWIIGLIVVGVLLGIVFYKKGGKTVKVDSTGKIEVIVDKDGHTLRVDDGSTVENVKQKGGAQNEIDVKKNSKVSGIEQG